MITYDKINLQNSLDMAVYYGAKKQAEVLNAMAHINYQMRQNWKLLAWRYRILGTLAQPSGGSPSQTYWCPQNSSKSIDCTSTGSTSPQQAQACRQAQNLFSRSGSYGSDYCDKSYFVCISQNLWKRGVSSSDQNLCTKKEITINPISPAVVTAPFMAEAVLAARGVARLIDEVSESCPAEGALNWLMTQFFMTHFRLDQKDRKVMLQEIYNRSLKEGRDLDGESISEGVKKVFCDNLSQANRKNAQAICNPGSSSAVFESFDSFENKNFTDIFGKINVWPVLQFLYSPSENNGNNNDYEAKCNVAIGQHYMKGPLRHDINSPPPPPPPSIFDDVQDILSDHGHLLAQSLKPEVEAWFNLNGIDYFSVDPDETDPLKDLTLSFFKKEDQILYYGLRVEFDYLPQNQIFSLSLQDPIKFKASAFAKPFGGHFGPQPQQSDPLIPVNHSQARTRIPNSNQINSALLQPNYSRFPGDKWGLIDRRLHDNSQPMNFLNKHSQYFISETQPLQRVYTMEDYFHLTLHPGKADDPLARHPSYDAFSFTRIMELIAVYPDLYDISFYSILGNYHETYFKKICKLLLNGVCDPNKRNEFNSTASSNRSFYIRGDFGWPSTKEYIEKNYSNKQVELSIAPYFLNQGHKEVNKDRTLVKIPQYTPIQPPPSSPPQSQVQGPELWGQNWDRTKSAPRDSIPFPLSQGNLFYPWLAGSNNSGQLPGGLLSSWVNPQPVNYREYKLDSNRFLKCDHSVLEDMPSPSACAQGGRSGYSVKLISCSAVKDFTNQPSTLDEFCPN